MPETPIIAVSDVKLFLGIPTAVTTDDTLLQALLDAAVKEAESRCRRIFTTATYTDEKYDGTGLDTLFLKNIPIASITSIYDDLDRVFPESTKIAAADIIVYDDKIVLDGLIFSSGSKNIKVTYAAGYSNTSIPADLKQAFVNLAAAAYIEAKGGINALESETVVYKPYNLRKQAYKMIEPYERYI